MKEKHSRWHCFCSNVHKRCMRSCMQAQKTTCLCNEPQQNYVNILNSETAKPVQLITMLRIIAPTEGGVTEKKTCHSHGQQRKMRKSCDKPVWLKILPELNKIVCHCASGRAVLGARSPFSFLAS